MSLLIEALTQPMDQHPTQDIDLIETLWRQDIDLGVTREAFDHSQRADIDKQKQLELAKQEKEKELEQKRLEEQNNTRNIAAYIVDRETGELIPAPDDASLPLQFSDQTQFVQPQPQDQNGIPIEEAMRMLEEGIQDYTLPPQGSTQNASVQQGLQEFEAMLGNVTNQYENNTHVTTNVTNQYENNTNVMSQYENNTQVTQQPPSFQRQNSSELRLQELVNLLGSIDGANNNSFDDLSFLNINDTAGGIPGQVQQPLVQNASFAALIPQTNSSGVEGLNYDNSLVPQNLLSPLDNTTSPHLLPTAALGLNNTGYQGSAGSFVNSSESLMQQLLSDDVNMADLDFNDMNVTGVTGSQAMDVNDTASMTSDSAISSGTSSVSSIQGIGRISSPTTDFCDIQSNISSPYDVLEGATGGSDSDNSKTYQSMETKYKYDPDQSYSEYSYEGQNMFRNHSDGSNSTEYGTESKMADPRKVSHNHTYPLAPGQAPKEHKSYPKPIKDDPDSLHDAQYSRDQKKAKELKVPFSMDEMIDSSVEKFNEMLQCHQLNEKQLQLIRDIRRRGKNKVAAQNCRKRKLDMIHTLEEEVEEMRRERDRLKNERRALDKDSMQVKSKFSHLFQEVFQNLRDEDGRPYDPNEYSLQQNDEGEVFVVPRNASSSNMFQDEPKSKSGRKRKDRKGH